ncbi:MAG: V-type ATPase 116kDa subunit family protein [Candidatus Cryptobacteroides sp.]|nr:ATPase V [Bacteroidales bacterium]MDY2774216.1 V-type ATPase 116kDa subunit family protein [Candidatus Cryptobacteroides sp.]
MTKYSFILLSEQTEGFLNSLQELGVVDISRSLKPIDEQSSGMLAEADRAKKALSILAACKAGSEKDFKFDGCPVDAVLETQDRIAEISAEIAAAKKEIAVRQPWGSFRSEDIHKLESQGLKLRFYSCMKKKFDPSWAEIQPLEVISETESKVFFVTVSPAEEEYSFPIEAVPAPEGSVNEAEEKLSLLQSKLEKEQQLLADLKSCSDEIRKAYNDSLSRLDLYFAEAATEKAVDNYLTVLTGFAPTSDDKRLCASFDSMDIYYSHEAATKEDNPPVKLKNNWFAKNFEVLTGMYGVPAYDEFDPTPVLGPFFMLFFAMCMGDAGYGILLMLIALVLRLKMKDSSLGKMHRLIAFLGGMTFVVGIFLGTFFGMSILEASWAPAWLKGLCIDGWFPDAKIAGFPVQMVLAVAIGVLHICLAMIIKTINFTKRFGFKKTVATWGWTTLIVGGLVVVSLGMTEVLSAEAFKWTIIALAVVSGLAIYVFNTPGRNPLLNIGSGLWDTYNMVTGLLGDVLSYIRLYALGLAGGMLGNAFNIMGTMILDIPVPGVNWVFCIIILIFGHVLNLAMSCLGAFVHPLRLTFVEYFKNSGYEGSGAKYNPLTKKK